MANIERTEYLGSVDQSEGRRVTLDTVKLKGEDVYVFKPKSAEIPRVPGNINYKGLFKIYETSSQGEAAWKSLFPSVTENLTQIREAIVPEVKIDPQRAIAFAEWDWYDIHKFIPPSIAEKGDSPLKYPAGLSHDSGVAIEAVIHQELPAEIVGFVLARNTDPLYEQEILLHQKHLKDEGFKRALAIRDSLRQSIDQDYGIIARQTELAVNV